MSIKQCYGVHWCTAQHQVMLHFTQEPTDQYGFFFQFSGYHFVKKEFFFFADSAIYLSSYPVLNEYFGELFVINSMIFVLSSLRASLLAVDHLSTQGLCLTVYRNHRSF